MTKHTVRDEVWIELIRQRDQDNNIVKPDIEQRVDGSDRTVHDVIQTAVENGALEKSTTTEEREDPRSEGSVQTKEVALFEPAELPEIDQEIDVDEDAVPLNDDRFDDDRDDTDSHNIEDGDTEPSTPTPDDDTTESISVPESDVDDDGFIDVEWPEGHSGTFEANFDGIGQKKSLRLAERFDSFDDLVTSEVSHLKAVEGIGQNTARAIKYRLMRAAFLETELDLDDVTEIDTKVIADMFNASEETAESFKASAIMECGFREEDAN